jgi:hypothetical protein
MRQQTVGQGSGCFECLAACQCCSELGSRGVGRTDSDGDGGSGLMNERTASVAGGACAGQRQSQMTKVK